MCIFYEIQALFYLKVKLQNFLSLTVPLNDGDSLPIQGKRPIVEDRYSTKSLT